MDAGLQRGVVVLVRRERRSRTGRRPRRWRCPGRGCRPGNQRHPLDALRAERQHRQAVVLAAEQASAIAPSDSGSGSRPWMPIGTPRYSPNGARSCRSSASARPALLPSVGWQSSGRWSAYSARSCSSSSRTRARWVPVRAAGGPRTGRDARTAGLHPVGGALHRLPGSIHRNAIRATVAPVRPTCSPLSAGSTRAACTPAGFSGSATSNRCAICTNSSNNTPPQL